MIRHLLLTIATGFLSCSAHGFSGIYAGLDAGLSIFTGDHTYTDAFGKDKQSFTKPAFLGGGHVGAMKEIGTSRTVLGIEGYINGTTTFVKENLRSSPAKTKVGTFEAQRVMGLGLAVIGGKLINPKVMIYAKAGFERGKFEIKYKNSLMSPTTKKVRKTLSAFVPGVGISFKAVERMLTKTDKVFVGFEYNYAGFYSDINTHLNSQSIRYKLKQSEHRIFAKLSYMI